jgi:phosphoribosylformimino-5-aminoimidazole carboxamide ribotide isomerase
VRSGPGYPRNIRSRRPGNGKRGLPFVFNKSIVVGIDARDGKVSTRAGSWNTELKPVEFALSMMKLGVRHFVFTDIGAMAPLTEPNFITLFELIDATKASIIASGGITTLTHLKLLQKNRSPQVP